ncbi:MAG: RidA family protein [Chloroflexota bacterium]
MNQEPIYTDKAPKPVGPYNQAIRFGQMVFVSGIIGLDPATGKMAGDEVETQTKQILENMCAILQGAGCSLKQVVKTTVYVTDLADFAAMNEVYAKYFGEMPPARATAQVVRLPAGAKVEIEAVAYVP